MVDPLELSAIERAVNGAAKRVNAAWLSLVLLMTYVLITTGKITHKDLFLSTPVRLPILAVDIPLAGYFWFIPLFIVASHFYFYLQLSGLAWSFAEYETTLFDVERIGARRARLRQRLDNSLFVRVIGSHQSDLQVVMRVVAWSSTVVAPVLLILFIQLTYLPNQDEPLTNWHRLLVLIDAMLAIYALTRIIGSVWVSMQRWPEESSIRFLFRYLRTSGFPDLLVSTLVVLSTLLISWFVATFPWEATLVRPLTQRLVGAQADLVALAPDKWFSNHLVLADQNLVEGFDLTKVTATRTARKRNFIGAIFDRADLRLVDFTGSNLALSSLNNTKLNGAKFGCAFSLYSSELDRSESHGCARLVSADLKFADLTSAELDGAIMFGADLRNATLKAARMSSTNLQGALLDSAVLDASYMGYAGLDGASLRWASLIGIYAVGVRFRGADLSLARIYGSNFNESSGQHAQFAGAQVQGSTFVDAHLEFTNFVGVAVFGTDISRAKFDHSNVANILTEKRWSPDLGWAQFMQEPPDLFQLPSERATKGAITDGYVDRDVLSPHYFDNYMEITSDAIEAITKATISKAADGLILPPLADFSLDAKTADWSEFIQKSSSEQEYTVRRGNRLIALACANAGGTGVFRGLIRSQMICPFAKGVDQTMKSGRMNDGEACENRESLIALSEELRKCAVPE